MLCSETCFEVVILVRPETKIRKKGKDPKITKGDESIYFIPKQSLHMIYEMYQINSFL